MSECKYPGCGLDVGARPYARSGIPSVTTVIDLANFDEKARKFSWAAGEKAAVSAVHRTQEWWELPTGIMGQPCRQDHKLCAVCGLDKLKAHKAKEGTKSPLLGDDGHKFVPGLCKACNFLRSQFHWDTEAKKHLGTHLHHLAVSWALGADIQSDSVTDPYLDGLEAWYGQAHPKFIGLERTVYFQAGVREYVGSFDMLVELDCTCDFARDGRCLWLVDIKSGQGQYDKEWMLQLSAYRYAQNLTSWDKGKQTLLEKMPMVAHTGVLWLHDDGHAEMVPVETNAEVFNQFQRLLDVWNWQKRVTKEEELEDAAV